MTWITRIEKWKGLFFVTIMFLNVLIWLHNIKQPTHRLFIYLFIFKFHTRRSWSICKFPPWKILGLRMYKCLWPFSETRTYSRTALVFTFFFFLHSATCWIYHPVHLLTFLSTFGSIRTLYIGCFSRCIFRLSLLTWFACLQQVSSTLSGLLENTPHFLLGLPKTKKRIRWN